MAHAIVCDTVEAHLAAQWAHPDIPIVGQNADGSAPTDGSSFLKVDFPWCKARPISIGSPGSNVHREEGGFRVIIYTPKGTGADVPRTWSAEIESMFRGRDLGNGLVCFSPATANDDQDNSGNYFVTAVAVLYEFDILG